MNRPFPPIFYPEKLIPSRGTALAMKDERELPDLEEMRTALAEHDAEFVGKDGLFEVFMYGCRGYANVGLEEVDKLYREVILGG